MAAENCVICLIDRLWFHHIILFPEPSLFHNIQEEDPKNTPQMISAVITTLPQDESSSQESDDDDEEERPTRLLNLVSSTKTRFHSSSPISAQKRSRTPRTRTLQKTMSCKSLAELELEEVKGFMDLGFIFRKDNLSKAIVALIPGLQRIDDDEDVDDDEEEKVVTRPYLSEAWIVRRPDSPLLNLRVPRVCTNADMKKHLKYWAQTVASAVQNRESK